MPKPSHNISIPNPCHEPWEGMTPHDQGRFCNSCQKCVIDFQSMTDREVLKFLAGPKGRSSCIKSDQSQLERISYFLKPQKSPRKWMFAAVVGGLLTSATLPAAYSQVEHKTITTTSAFLTVSENPEKLHFLSNGVIQGRVLDKNEITPLEGVKISIPNLNIETFTDKNGEYTLYISSFGETFLTFNIHYSDQEELQYKVSITQEEFQISIPDLFMPPEPVEVQENEFESDEFKMPPLHKRVWWWVKDRFRKKTDFIPLIGTPLDM